MRNVWDQRRRQRDWNENSHWAQALSSEIFLWDYTHPLWKICSFLKVIVCFMWLPVAVTRLWTWPQLFFTYVPSTGGNNVNFWYLFFCGIDTFISSRQRGNIGEREREGGGGDMQQRTSSWNRTGSAVFYGSDWTQHSPQTQILSPLLSVTLMLLYNLHLNPKN